MKRFLFIFLFPVLSACDTPSITGQWIQPTPGMEHMYQGIEIFPDGTAKSINMATLQYKTWEKNGDKITLCGASIGNKQIIDFCEEFKINTLTYNKFIISNEYITSEYRRKK